MSENGAYDALVMDHIRHARNFRVIEDANRYAKGVNPLCGDEMSVYLTLTVDRIDDIAYQCTCCGISMASASIMTQMVKGRRGAEAKLLLRDFMKSIDRCADPPSRDLSVEQLAIRETVLRFPSRARCSALPWATLEAALHQQDTAVVR